MNYDGVNLQPVKQGQRQIQANPLVAPQPVYPPMPQQTPVPPSATVQPQTPVSLPPVSATVKPTAPPPNTSPFSFSKPNLYARSLSMGGNNFNTNYDSPLSENSLISDPGKSGEI